MLNDRELVNIMNRGESDCVEFTESTSDLDKIRQAICAFANNLPNDREPGLVFIGIRDDRICADLPIDDELLEKLGGLQDDGKIHPFPTMEVGKRNLNDCEVAVIQVKPSTNPPVKSDGRCWIRVGSSSAQASAEEERRLTEKRQWGNVPYDMQGVIDASVENDLDMLQFANEYLPAAVSPEALQENDRNSQDQLKALRLTTQDETPTVTAILMLGKDPHYWFPGAYIQFVRFEGNEITDPIKDHKEIHGTLPDQLRKLDDTLKAHIFVALDTHGERHQEAPDYPYVALRELARNAVIHRKYKNSYTPVRIHWFADYVEIISPASVYGAVTKSNFGEPGATAYRNPTITEAMKNMKFMQRFGIGISTARKALQDNGNPPPEFDIQDTLIFATIKTRQSQSIQIPSESVSLQS